MADLEKTVRIIFKGEDKELQSAAIGAAKNFDAVSAAADRISAPLARAFDAVLKVDAALAALAIGGMALAVRESANFNQGFALISTSVEATGADLDTYRGQVLDYAKTSVKSMDDINSALYTAAQAGIKWTESLEFMGAAEQLAVANNANLNATVDLLTGTMNAYGYTIEDVGHLNDVFFQSTLIGKQTIDSLGQSMGQVVGIAANFGVSFEQLSSAISTLTAKGMETSEAITAVKSVITTIVSPSREAAEAARALGLDFSASSLKAQGFDGMLRAIMTATGGSADKMAGLFSEVRALNGAMQITGDGMAFFNNALQQINASSGASEAAYKKMVETFSNQSQLLLNTAQTVMIDIGTKLEPIAAGIGGEFAKVFAAIGSGVNAGAFDPLFAALESAGKEFSVFLAGIAKALPEALKDLDFSKLLDAFRALGVAFSSYFEDLDLTNVKDLHGFIQGLVDSIAGLVRVTGAMVDAFRPFFNAVKDFLISMARGDEESLKMVGTLMTLGKVVKEAGLAVTGAIKAIDHFGMSTAGLFNVIAGGVQILWNFVEQLKNLAVYAGLAMQGRVSELPRVFQDMRQDGADAAAGLEKIARGLDQMSGSANKATESTARTNKEIQDIPEEKKTILSVEGYSEMQAAIRNVTREFVVAGTEIDKAFAGEKKVNVGYSENASAREEIKKNIETSIPAKKTIDVGLEMERLKQDAKTVQTAIEWKAKVDIAEVDAGVQKVKTMFESINVGIKSTGDLIGSLFGQLNNASRWNEDKILDQIEAENKMRQQQFDLQKKLIEAQTEYQKIKNEAVARGDLKIEVSAAGLEPHLEMILWEVLSAIQVRANDAAAEFLLGV